MQHQQPPPMRGPLATPKAFRRPTGAHAILAAVLLADLAGFLFWLVMGAFAWPLCWWLVRLGVSRLHASLILDIGIVLLLGCFLIGITLHLLKKDAEAAWSVPVVLIIVQGAVLALLFLIEPALMRIPARAIPVITAGPFPWPLPFSLSGALTAAGFFLLAHLAVLRRARSVAAKHLLPFSRAHPDGTLWAIVEQAYGYFQRGLLRFAHPPITRLGTPPTFFYYPPQPPSKEDGLLNLERELQWVSGELVINQAYISPKPEHTEILLPLLARLLHDYHSPNRLVDQLLGLTHLAESSKLSEAMLWLPLLVASACERRWLALERDRVLDRDRFAWWCGEGGRLRKLLHRMLAERHRRNMPDNAVPTLTERIDHLDSLLRREARQVQALRAALPPASTALPASDAEN